MAFTAAIAPSEVAVTSCLKDLGLISPATYIPSILVFKLSSDLIYPFSSNFKSFVKLLFSGI